MVSALPPAILCGQSSRMTQHWDVPHTPPHDGTRAMQHHSMVHARPHGGARVTKQQGNFTSATAPVSAVRTRMMSATGLTKIFPSPTSPVLAALQMILWKKSKRENIRQAKGGSAHFVASVHTPNTASGTTTQCMRVHAIRAPTKGLRVMRQQQRARVVNAAGYWPSLPLRPGQNRTHLTISSTWSLAVTTSIRLFVTRELRPNSLPEYRSARRPSCTPEPLTSETVMPRIPSSLQAWVQDVCSIDLESSRGGAGQQWEMLARNTHISARTTPSSLHGRTTASTLKNFTSCGRRCHAGGDFRHAQTSTCTCIPACCQGVGKSCYAFDARKKRKSPRVSQNLACEMQNPTVINRKATSPGQLAGFTSIGMQALAAICSAGQLVPSKLSLTFLTGKASKSTLSSEICS